MATLYVVSTERLAGKTAFCIGLARHLLRAGQQIGYMKPFSAHSLPANEAADEDAVYLKKDLNLPDLLEAISPVNVHSAMLEQLLSGDDGRRYRCDLEKAFEQVAKGRDTVLLEGGSNLREGALVELAPRQVAGLLHARSLVMIKYSGDEQIIDDALTSSACMGDSFAGVVLNCIPRPELRLAEEVVKPALEKRGIPVLAVLPLERLLESVSVHELTESLSGEVLCCQDQTDELVEHVMVGAMSAASALSYFRLKPNKAVITGWDRTDIQYAALETSTRCLILTGNNEPVAGVRHRAQEVGVPLIRVRQDTMAAVDAVQRTFGRTRCHHPNKVERFEEMLADRLDLEHFASAIGAA